MRLVAAPRDPTTRKAESSSYLATSLPRAQVSAAQVYELYRWRDGIAHSYQPVRQELGWAGYQVRAERAMVQHWGLVLVAYTFSLLVGAVPTPPASDPSTTPEATGGGKIGARPSPRVRGAGRLDRHAAQGTQLALPVGTAAALLTTLVTRRTTA